MIEWNLERRESWKERDTMTKEEWSTHFDATFPIFSEEIFTSFPLILNVLLFDKDKNQQSKETFQKSERARVV